MQVDGAWQLGDFSLVASAAPEGGKQGIDRGQLGTDGYRTPELITHNEYCDKADVWAMGCIMNELLCGKKLFAKDYEVTKYANEAIDGIWTVGILKPVAIQLQHCLVPFNWRELNQIKSTLLQMFAVSPTDRPTPNDLIFNAFQKLVDHGATP